MSVTTLLATTGRGIARAVRRSADEWAVELALSDCRARCLAATPSAPERVFAGTYNQGVLQSGDAGKTWEPIGLAGQTVTALSVSRLHPQTIYAGTNPARMFVSRDGGVAWTELLAFRNIPWRWLWFSPAERPFSAYVQAIALSPTDHDHLIVGIEAGAVVESRDGGHTWTGHRPGALRDCHSLTFHPADGKRVYEAGGSGAGVSCSQDAGETWRQPRAGLDRHYAGAVAADPTSPDVWYASVSPAAWKAHSDHNAQAAIVRSTGGQAWQALAGGLPQPLAHMPYALFTDAEAPGHLYAGLSNGE